MTSHTGPIIVGHEEGKLNYMRKRPCLKARKIKEELK